jgi:hypothetical protein
MYQPLLPAQEELLKSFNKWLRKLFNAGQFGKQPPFSTNWHHDATGNLLIDNGRMLLVLMTDHDPYVLKSLEGESLLTISSGDCLSKLLMDGLHHAIDREFVTTYT